MSSGRRASAIGLAGVPIIIGVPDGMVNDTA
jgi:hypothetical protein